MRIRLGDLRRLVFEEVERNMRWSAGMVGGGLNSSRHGEANQPPPGLGLDDDERDGPDGPEYGEEQTKQQAAVRVDGRARQGRQARPSRRG